MLERQPSDRGMTLVELLVAIMIVGVLSAIAYAMLIGQQTRARYAVALQLMSAIESDVLAYRVQHGEYPSDAPEGVAPRGAEVNWTLRDKMPWGSPMDYDLIEVDGQCQVGVVFYGSDGDRQSPGLEQAGDDRVLVFWDGEC